MKAKSGFNLREVCGEQIIVADGEENIDFSNIISMNESAAYLWRNLQDKEFTLDDMVRLLLEAYDVDEEVARKDAELLAAQWKKAEIITGDDMPDIEVTCLTNDKSTTPAKEDTPTKEQEEKKGFFGKIFRK
jgi:hypothetical protein